MIITPTVHDGKMETGTRRVLFGVRVGAHAILTVRGQVWCDCHYPVHKVHRPT